MDVLTHALRKFHHHHHEIAVAQMLVDRSLQHADKRRMAKVVKGESAVAPRLAGIGCPAELAKSSIKHPANPSGNAFDGLGRAGKGGDGMARKKVLQKNADSLIPAGPEPGKRERQAASRANGFRSAQMHLFPATVFRRQGKSVDLRGDGLGG